MASDIKKIENSAMADSLFSQYSQEVGEGFWGSLFKVPRDKIRTVKQKISVISLSVTASVAIIVLLATVGTMISYSSRIYSQPELLWEILTNNKFDPGDRFDDGDWGIWPMIYGTFVVGIPALLVSLFWGLGIATFLSEYASDKWGRRLQSLVEFFAAMPSIILGLIAVRYLSDITRFLFQREWFVSLTAFMGFNEGRGIIVASSNIIWNAVFVIAVMATPTIASISMDAMKSTPSTQRLAVKALGGTKKEVYETVVYPHAKKTIYASVLLAFGRIIGETMIVTVALGANAYIGVHSMFGFIPVPNLYVNGITLTSLITTYFGEASAQSDIRQYLFLAGAILLIFSFTIIAISSMVINENKYFIRLVEVLYSPITLLSARVDQVKEKFRGASEITQEQTEILISKRTRNDRIYKFYNGFVMNFYIFFSFGLIFMMTREGFTFLARGQSFFGGIINFFGFIFQLPILSVMSRGEYGAFPALIGSISLVLMASLFAFPIATATGVYLYEFARDNRYSQIIRQTMINISAVPSIVIGLFAYAAFVVSLGYGKGLIAGGAALAIMMVPIVTTNTIEALRNVPETHRESALALGATNWEAFKTHRLPYAFPSIITGYILGIARVIGETAPILFTIASITNTVYPDSLTNQPLRILTYEIFFNMTLQTRQVDGFRIGPVWASALAIVLLLFIAILNIIAFAVRKFLRSRYEHNGSL